MARSRWTWAAVIVSAFVAAAAADGARAMGPAASQAASAFACPGPSGAATPFEERRYDAGAAELAYSEGPRNGPTLLFIPGMGVPRQSYAPAARRLCDRFHVVVVDQRGQGQSSWAADGRYRVVDYGHDIVGLIRHDLGGEPVIVSGHSLGGLVALWLAAEHPELVIGLNAEDNPFLISEHGRWETHWVRPNFVALEQRLVAYHAAGEDRAVLRQLYASAPIVIPDVRRPYSRRIMTLGKWLSNLTAAGLKAADSQEQGRMDRAYAKFLAGQRITNGEFWPAAMLDRLAFREAGMDPRVVHANVTAEVNDGFDHRQALAKVRAPVLFWTSDQDLLGVLTPAEIQDLVDLAGQHNRVKLEVAANTGHLIHAEIPDRYASEIRAFFLPASP
jgi:pimeloyl-ACP methyl ester carboxylesterase